MLRSIKYGLHAAVLAGVLAAPLAWNAIDKSVDIVVDGHGRTVHTTAASVGDALADHGYRLTAHDIVAPSRSSSLRDGERIVLRRGRLLHLNVDGAPKNIWTTAPTVADAMSALGYPTADFISVSRSKRLPLSPTAISVRTPQLVTVVHDGQRNQVSTTDATVGSLLQDLSISVGRSDRLSTPMTAALEAGQTITLQRVTTKTLTRVQKLRFDTTRHKNAKADSGVTKVLTKGRDGRERITYTVLYVDGKATSRTRTGSRVLAAPRTQVESIGTRKVLVANTPNAPAPSPGSAKAIAKQLLAQRGWGNDQFSCLVQMWNNESGWSTHAANPSGAYGIPQALPGSKMSSAGPDWENDATTQIKWGIGYVAERYGTPCGAWSFWQAHGYY